MPQHKAAGQGGFPALARGVGGVPLGGFTVNQLAILTAIYSGEDSKGVREIAAELGISKPTITRTADKLENIGLIQRIVPSTDLRLVIFIRTRMGEKVLAGIARVLDKAA